MRTYYVPGEWNALCDRCGFQFKASMLRLEWTGFRVCDTCWESRHPQTLIKLKGEKISVPWARPPDDTFINTSDPISTESESVILTEAGDYLGTESDS